VARRFSLPSHLRSPLLVCSFGPCRHVYRSLLKKHFAAQQVTFFWWPQKGIPNLINSSLCWPLGNLNLLFLHGFFTFANYLLLKNRAAAEFQLSVFLSIQSRLD